MGRRGQGPGVSVRPSVQGGREAYPRRRPLRIFPGQDGGGLADRGDMGAGRVMAEEDSSFPSADESCNAPASRNGVVPESRLAMASAGTEPPLKVATVYQDPLTRHWATELWDRVGRSIGQMCGVNPGRLASDGSPGLCRRRPGGSRSGRAGGFGARRAENGRRVCTVWIDAWLPKRAGREGALVALIGVPGQPDAQSGRAHKYLETVARQGRPGFHAAGAQAAGGAVSFLSLGRIASVANTPGGPAERAQPAPARGLKYPGDSTIERAARRADHLAPPRA